MIESLRVRWTIVAAVFIAALIWSIPNFVNLENKWWPTKNKMVLGLDIQGGSHLVLRVDIDSAVKQDATRMAATLPRELADKKIEVKKTDLLDPLSGKIQFQLEKPEDAKAINDYINTMYSSVYHVDSEDANQLTIAYNELYIREFKTKLLDQAIAVIRNRIDEFGVAEPTIVAQGADHILVQLPGIQDASSAKELINRTARLEFMMLAEDKVDLAGLIKTAETENKLSLKEMKYTLYVDKLNEALKSKLPPNRVVYFQKPDNAVNLEADRIPFLLKTDETVPGDRLINAFVQPGQNGEPAVGYKFDAVGGRLNAELTSKNIGKPMAIVLDKTVKSTPVIQGRIADQGQITMGRSRDYNEGFKEAKLLATSLRAGALPAALEQVEERTVGPSLGADAIRQGQIGTLIAACAVFLFMIIIYRTLGFVADLSLAFNLLITIAILSSLGATLTLPGVAGLALTLGIAVDASVIIFERVKEERRKGATDAAAIREGYAHALPSIIDANITSIAVAVVIYYFGTGPIRGFAITLLTGLVITLFTAVFFTRVIFDTVINKFKWHLPVAR
jgi:preprotein translocase subunit SecD